MAHAKLSPSSAKTWLSCVGSIAMQEGMVDTPSEYSDEGTAAHFLASECLTSDAHPATFIGRTILVGDSACNEFDGAVWAEQPELADWKLRHSFEVDTDMVAHVNTYVQDIKAAAASAPDAVLLVEQRLPIGQFTGEEGAEGTGDAVILIPSRRQLQLRDLKYGMGDIVSPEDNPQLMLYALAALDQYELLGDFDEVLLGIHQPRVYHKPSEWVVSVAKLREFATLVRETTDLVWIAYEHRANWLPNSLSASVTYLTATTDGCRWCKAKASCPALAQKVMSAVADDFVDLEAPIAPQLEGCDERVMPPEVLANAFEAVDIVEMWCKAVRTKVFVDLSAGIAVPRQKLVRGKKGNRQWEKADEAEAMLKMMKLKVEEMYDMKVISPTSAEKIFGEKGSAPSVKRWNKLQTLIVQKEGALSVAPESDPRPAVVVDRAADFSDDSGDDLA